MLDPKPKNSGGSKQSHQEKKRKAFRAPAATIPSKTESPLAPILQLTPLDTGDHSGVDGRGSAMRLVPPFLRSPWVSIRQLIARRLGVQGKR